jgi:DNA-binding MurR/RpiR family transcriptional regulator
MVPAELGSDGTRTLALIRSRLAALSTAEQRIAACILEEPTTMVRISITELAERAGVGEATVSRFCRRLGLQGFQHLKISIATELSPSALALDDDEAEVTGLPTATSTPHREAARAAALLERTAVLLDEHALSQAAQALAQARSVTLYGQGASAIAALDAQHSLFRLGLASHAPLDTHTQAMAAALLRPGDVSLAISHSGSSKDVVGNQVLARKNGAETICITGTAHSPLAAESNVVLLTATEETLVSNLRRRMAQLFILQLLVQECARIIGKPAHDALDLTTAAIVDKIY